MSATVHANPVMAEFYDDPFIDDLAERAASYLDVNFLDMSADASVWQWTPEQIAEARPILEAIAGRAPFVFDRDYNNVEQVRPYFAAYSVIRARLDGAGQVNYNDAFVGLIPAIAGPSETTGIYLLQTMHTLDAMRADVAAFIESGGVPADDVDLTVERRGDVAAYGWYVGGTGWQLHENVRVSRDIRGRVIVKRKGERRGSYVQGTVLVRVHA